MSKLTSGVAALAFFAVSAITTAASANWFSDAIEPADLVAGGMKWNVLTIESEDGFDAVHFLPAGKTADEASETLTFTAAVEEVPSSAYDAQAVLNESNTNDNTKHYTSQVNAGDQSVKARGLYVEVPGRTYSQLFSLRGKYRADGKTFFGVTYRVNIISDSKIAKNPGESLDIMDSRVAKISDKQVEDWFKYFYEKAKRKLAMKKAAETPNS